MTMKNKTITVKIVWDEESQMHTASVDEVPAINTCGETIPETLEMVADVFRLLEKCEDDDDESR